MVGALIVGSEPDERKASLSRFLTSIARSFIPGIEVIRLSATMQTMVLGHPALFLPSIPG